MYSLNRLIHHPHHFLINGFSALTINYLMMQLSLGMAGMFGVLFLYEIGEGIGVGLGMTSVLIFFVFQRLIIGLVAPVAGYLTEKIGYRRMILAAEFFWAAKLIFLAGSTKINWLLAPAVFFGGLAIAFYYIPFHGLFLDDHVKRRAGEQIGTIDMIGQLAAIVSPFAAGLVIDKFNYSIMFSLSTILLVISSIPLFFMRHHHYQTNRRFELSGVSAFFKSNKRLSWALFFWHVEDAILTFFWPIYLFLIVKSHTLFGIIGSAVMITSAVVIYLAGRIYDRRPLRRVYPAATATVSLAWILRFLATTPLTAGFADIMHRLFSPLWWMKIRQKELVAGEKMSTVEFGVAHELLITAGAIVGLAVGYWLLAISSGNWGWLLIPALIGVVVSAKLTASPK